MLQSTAKVFHRALHCVQGGHVQEDWLLIRCAAAGWYTFPDPALSWPYGLKNSALTAKLQQSWQTSLAQELVLLLGDQDTSTNGKHLRQNTEAMSQGGCLQGGDCCCLASAVPLRGLHWHAHVTLLYAKGKALVLSASALEHSVDRS